MKHFLAALAIVLSACGGAVSVTQTEPRPNINLAPHAEKLRLQLGDAVKDAWIIPGNSPKPDWHRKAIISHDEALAAAGRSKQGREYPIILNIYCGADTKKAQELILRLFLFQIMFYQQSKI